MSWAARSDWTVAIAVAAVACAPHARSVGYGLDVGPTDAVRTCSIGGRPWSKLVDLDLDGQPDALWFLGPAGELRHEALDGDHDGAFEWFNHYCRDRTCWEERSALRVGDDVGDLVAWWAGIRGVSRPSACWPERPRPHR